MPEEIDEQPTPVITEGEVLTPDALARKLKGNILAAGGEVKHDEDTAIAALMSYDESAGFTNLMSNEDLENFIDDFCEAWQSEVQ